MFDMGAIEQNIAKQAMRSGAPLPDRIAAAPELFLGLELYLQAFFDLDTERNHANGPCAIPYSAIARYAEINKFDEEQTGNLHYFVRQMDEENLKRVASKIEERFKQ